MLSTQVALIWLTLRLLLGSALKRDFVTTENFTLPVNDGNVKRMQDSFDAITDVDFYKLRFQPVAQMPRLFFNKLPQLEEPTTMAPPTMMMETDTPPTEPPPAMVTEMPTPATEPPNEPQPESSTTTPRPPKRATTTTRRSAIMRPTLAQAYAPKLHNRLKELLLFGSPIEANLIQKQQQQHGSNSNAPKSTTQGGKGFLSLFEVIKFPNSKCTVSMADIRSMEGVCYHDFECKSLGGISTERCADGVGVCCIFLTGCGDLSNQPIVYFESPNYPNAVRELMICVLIVQVRKNVQQLRLDFLMFELNRPTDGDCVEDQFTVSGHNMNFQVPTLCGINTGQHMYVHVGNSLENKIYLSVFVKVPTGGRSFNIKITQLESDLAPDGCLQYHTEPAGILKSFNYDLDGSIVDLRQATYLNNLNYVICLARGKHMCSITYAIEQNENNEQLDFQIINKDEAENDLVSDGQAGAGIFNCPDDFISINSVRLCGERFNDGTDNEDFNAHAPIRDTSAGPIMLPFRSDGEYVGRGFRLLYKQELCT